VGVSITNKTFGKAYQRKESFLVQQFLENAAEVKGEQPLSLPAGSETPQ
jgi:hypothetical protein